jgi:hypothetical protein
MAGRRMEYRPISRCGNRTDGRSQETGVRSQKAGGRDHSSAGRLLCSWLLAPGSFRIVSSCQNSPA